MTTASGRFVWYELMTTDMEAATAFYTKVVGWQAHDTSAPGRPYTLFAVGEASVSGLMKLSDAAMKMGAKPRWTGYIAVDDVDAAAARVKQLGGAVHVPPTNVSNLSRFAVIADPQTASLALIKWLRPFDEVPDAPGQAGRIGWCDLLATDVEGAFAFYGELFGWRKAAAYADGAAGIYQLFASGDQTIGGMFDKPPAEPVPFWLYYFNVEDIDAAAERVHAGGGTVLSGALEVADGSFIVQCADPQHASFALVGKRSRRSVGYFERTGLPTSADPRSRRWSW